MSKQKEAYKAKFYQDFKALVINFNRFINSNLTMRVFVVLLKVVKALR